jgi:hypothetical protein
MIRYDTIYDTIWYDMIRYMIWYGMIRYDMVWYDMVWYDMVWYDMIYDKIRYDMLRYNIWYDMIYDMIWYDTIWCDTIYDWYGMTLHDMIWCDMIWYVMIWYDIFVKLQLGWYPVAIVQYTFTHKQYTERHKTTIHGITQTFWKSAGRAPSLRVLPWHLPYNWGKSTEKPQSG